MRVTLIFLLWFLLYGEQQKRANGMKVVPDAVDQILPDQVSTFTSDRTVFTPADSTASISIVDGIHVVPVAFDKNPPSQVSTFISEKIVFAPVSTLSQVNAFEKVFFYFDADVPTILHKNRLYLSYSKLILAIKITGDFEEVNHLKFSHAIKAFEGNVDFVNYDLFYYNVRTNNYEPFTTTNINILSSENSCEIGVPIVAKHKVFGDIKFFGMVVKVERCQISEVKQKDVDRIVDEHFKSDQIINQKFIVPLTWNDDLRTMYFSVFIKGEVAVSLPPSGPMEEMKSLTFHLHLLDQSLQDMPGTDMSDLGVFVRPKLLVIMLKKDLQETKIINPITINQEEIIDLNVFDLYFCGYRYSDTPDVPLEVFMFCESIQKVHHEDNDNYIVESDKSAAEDIGSTVISNSHGSSLVGLAWLILYQDIHIVQTKSYSREINTIIDATNSDTVDQVVVDFFKEIKDTKHVLRVPYDTVSRTKTYLDDLINLNLAPNTGLYTHVKEMSDFLVSLTPNGPATRKNEYYIGADSMTRLKKIASPITKFLL